MSLKKIRVHNDQKFIDAIHRVHDVMVYAPASNSFLKTSKKEVMKEAETSKIVYKINNRVFVNRRDVMIIQ